MIFTVKAAALHSLTPRLEAGWSVVQPTVAKWSPLRARHLAAGTMTADDAFADPASLWGRLHDGFDDVWLLRICMSIQEGFCGSRIGGCIHRML
jgi:hypothetical protein